jgi:hypothetical protein
MDAEKLLQKLESIARNSPNNETAKRRIIYALQEIKRNEIEKLDE